MKRAGSLTLIVIVAYTIFISNATILQAADDGFVPLFGSEGLTGWKVSDWSNLTTPQRVPGTPWKLENGVLSGLNKRTWLISPKQYSNFVLQLETKITRGSNGGIGLRFPPADDPAYTAMEIQVVDSDVYYRGSSRPNQRTGSIYDEIAPSKNAVKPVDQWNSWEITARGSQVTIVLNGQKIIDTDLSRETEARQQKGPAMAKRPLAGHIGFQNLNGFITLRNLMIRELDGDDKPAQKNLTVSNPAISVTLDTADATLAVTDKRTGRTWRQKAKEQGKVLQCKKVANGFEMTFRHPALSEDIKTELRLGADKPEFTVSLSAKGKPKWALGFPHPFVTEPGTYLVVPMNEGISYPVDDQTIKPKWLVAYGGHGICMAFWGVTDGSAGQMAIIETPDDALIHINRIDGKLCVAPKWERQKGNFGYTRKLRYVFFDKGGHVAMCKRYRAYVKTKGQLKTLAQKRKENPNVDLLIGAVNVWCWEKDALGIVRQMKSVGIERILWSHRDSPQTIKAMNEIPGVLTSRYDIYQDLMDPKVVKEKLWRVHPDWTQDGWPKDIMLDGKGDWRKGWRVKAKDGQMYPCGVLCDKQAVKYARQRVPEELKTHPYRCRFIDTTTASPWRECYDPDHPMTRGDSRHWKMELLRYMSEDMKLVTGSETGHDAAVPFVHYFEGMFSLGSYRVPDAGRNMSKIWDEVPERVAKFQVGHKYRLPLWELVYHDCVVAQWYWGDYNNKLPAIWPKRDLFNILYGTGAMFMFKKDFWTENKNRFAESYKSISTVARAAGYAEMTDHRFLTPDRDVQQTKFANGPAVTVNFGDKPYRLPDGTEVKPMGYHVRGL